MSKGVAPCPGILVWFPVFIEGEEVAALLECSACDYIIATGWWHDEAHALNGIIREGI